MEENLQEYFDNGGTIEDLPLETRLKLEDEHDCKGNAEHGCIENCPNQREEEEHTLDDVLDAFKAYAAKHSRDKALAILKKYKVKAVKDLDESKYAEVLKKLAK